MTSSGIHISTDLDATIVDVMGSDDSILDAMLVSTAKDINRRPRGEKEPGQKDKDRGRLNFLMKNRHGTPFEHTAMTVRIHAPIFVVREWQRHRVQSYNEQSGRYTQFEPKFYVPHEHRPLVQQGKPGRYEFVKGTQHQDDIAVLAHYEAFRVAWEQYEAMIEEGVAMEVARNVLPLATYTNFYATANIRAWLHFLGLRTKDENALYPSYPLWEIERLALQVEDMVIANFPITHEVWDRNGRVAP